VPMIYSSYVVEVSVLDEREAVSGVRVRSADLGKRGRVLTWYT
jgi:hypothetical protein